MQNRSPSAVPRTPHITHCVAYVMRPRCASPRKSMVEPSRAEAMEFFVPGHCLGLELMIFQQSLDDSFYGPIYLHGSMSLDDIITGIDMASMVKHVLS